MNFDFEKYNVPFDHYIVDNFLPDDIAKSISNDFLDYENQKWHFYGIFITTKLKIKKHFKIGENFLKKHTKYFSTFVHQSL